MRKFCFLTIKKLIQIDQKLKNTSKGHETQYWIEIKLICHQKLEISSELFLGDFIAQDFRLDLL